METYNYEQSAVSCPQTVQETACAPQQAAGQNPAASGSQMSQASQNIRTPQLGRTSGEAGSDGQSAFAMSAPENMVQEVQAAPSSAQAPSFSEPASPGFGPIGPVTPSLPSNSGNNCVSCGPGQGTIPGLLGTILWSWGAFPPTATPSSVSHVRFYNAASIREPLDIYLNGRLVVSDLDYMNYTRYLHILPGNYLLTVYRRTNPGGAPIINNRVQFQSGSYYMLTIRGGPSDYSVQLVSS